MRSPLKIIALSTIIIPLAVLLMVIVWKPLGVGVDAALPFEIHGTYFKNARNIPAFSVSKGKTGRFDDQDFNHHWTFVFFGYTRCPDICPTTLNLLKQVDAQLSTTTTPKPEVVFISLDPEHDTPEAVLDYARYFNPHFIGLVGTPDTLAVLTKSFGVVAQRVPMTHKPEDYLLDHSTTLFLINPKAQIQAILTAPHAVETLVQEYQEIVRKS
jgi:protein SCO1/2